MTVEGWAAEHCIKCNICTLACPVAAVTEEFLGPKAVGPQAERFRHPRIPPPDDSVSWCSGCGVCSRVCPHGVPVTELNILAKARVAANHGIPWRDQLISRPALLADLARPVARLANALLAMAPARALAETLLGVSRHASLPRFAARTFRSSFPQLQSAAPERSGDAPLVAYFHGCSVNAYEPDLGRLAVEVLERLGFDVVLPPQTCCGLPLQSNGLLEAARRNAAANLRGLVPFAEADVPIVGTSTSCVLALKHEYRAILGLTGSEADLVAEYMYDFFEFLRERMPNLPATRPMRSVAMRILYHPPCQLQGHAVGWPALDILRQIPGLDIVVSESDCCGVAGTYGLKKERYGVAREVGRTLFAQSRREEVEAIVTDSETCRWWTEGHTGIRSVHPLVILAAALGVPTSIAMVRP
ncbi:MAG TPA: anaerobic glycerol-3-phosphate dehydrogenase subunit C [Anaerolineales bacterium]|nr:anaerobic glycerol-3-phosphate dehydrogenase subunit C [Anaerolineales bacterium]